MKIKTETKTARLILYALLLSVFGFSSVSFAAQINFNSWSAAGGSGYTWNVSDGAWTGSDVVPSVPSSPEGLFINGSAATNYTLTGKMKVEGTSDNDMIGLVFGYQDDSHYYALDWKQAAQTYSNTFADEGFTLFRIDDSSAPDFWNHPTDSSDILFTQYGSDEGWADNTEYDFTLTYTPTSFSIVISDGMSTLFSHTETGSFADGRYGAYNFSQAHTRYSDFQVSSVPIPGAVWLLGSGLLGLAVVRRRK